MNGELTSVLILCVYFAAFIQTDSELRYLADGVAVPVSEVREPQFNGAKYRSSIADPMH